MGPVDGLRLLIMARTYDYIIGPAEGHAAQRVTSPERYLAVQAQYLKNNRDHGVDDSVPHDATPEEIAAASAPYISVGQWVMDCACKNAPSVSIEWDLACCFECGAIYRSLPFPPDRAAIESVLLQRIRRARNWTPAETLADLIAQNLANGDEVPDGL